MKVLLTGASGFIGGRFLQRFRARPGLEILGVGRRTLAEPDYRSIDLSRPFTLDFRPDVVIHAAALAVPWACRTGLSAPQRRRYRARARLLLRGGRSRLVYLS